MKKCCEELKKYMNDSSCPDGWRSIIYEENNKYYIIEKIHNYDDGDGRIDTLVDEKQIFYCPFCGKKLGD